MLAAALLLVADPPTTHVMESIVLPGKEVASGFSGDMMPDDYATRIAPRDLEPLVEFVMHGASR